MEDDILTKEDCAILSIHGCPKCLAFLDKEPNESCWDWGKKHPEKVAEYVQQMLDEMGVDGKNIVFCTTCQTRTIVDPKKIEWDDYVNDGTHVIKCNKCGELMPVAKPEFVI